MLKIILLVATLLLSHYSFAATVIGGDVEITDTGSVDLEIGQGGSAPLVPGEPLSLLHTVNVSGDLFLDYSLFSNDSNLNLTSDTSLVANTITIFSYSDTPTIPAEYSTYVYSTSNLILNDEGSWAIFGQSPISGGYFEATGNLYIGNYSSIAPVPIPPAFALFLSGLFVPLVLRIRSRSNQLIKRSTGLSSGSRG